MKKLILVATCLLFSTSLLAREYTADNGTRFKTTDNSPAAQLCMAALESRDALRAKARELKMSRKRQKQVKCNDMSLVEFAKAYRNDMREWSIATVQ